MIILRKNVAGQPYITKTDVLDCLHKEFIVEYAENSTEYEFVLSRREIVNAYEELKNE